jgi:hypothetical protein
MARRGCFEMVRKQSLQAEESKELKWKLQARLFLQRPVVQSLRKADYHFMGLPKSVFCMRVDRPRAGRSLIKVTSIVAVAAEKYLRISSAL